MPHVYLSIGSNLDDPLDQVRRVIETLRGLGVVSAVSPFYRTKPWGTIKNQPYFINAVVALETQLAPHELLKQLKAIEMKTGRSPDDPRWGPRVIDLDILTYDHVTIDDPELQIPHPRLTERAFVLVPLADLDPAFQIMRDTLPEEELRGVERVRS